MVRDEGVRGEERAFQQDLPSPLPSPLNEAAAGTTFNRLSGVPSTGLRRRRYGSLTSR